MAAPRSAALFALFVVLASLSSALVPKRLMTSGNAAPATAVAGRGDPLASLRKQAEQARTELQKATRQWEARKKKLADSQRKLELTLQALSAADIEWNRIRAPLAAMANAAYEAPGSAGSMAIFGGGDPDEALRTAADLTHVADGQKTLIDKADVLRRRHEQLSATAQALQSQNAVEQVRLARTIDDLKQRSADLTHELTASLAKLTADRYRKFLHGCDRNLAGRAKQYPNGLIPARYLCPLPQRPFMLRADAAVAFYKLNEAYKKRFGQPMCLRDAYRNLAEQQRLYATRPGFAAVPGTSNHGLGQAIDICGGVQNQGSVQFNWMRANSGTYGWFHPSWAYSNPFEPWHWEYGTEAPH